MKDNEYVVKMYTTTYNDVYKVILNDISNKKLYDYDLYNSLDIEVIGNSNTLDKLYIKE